MPEKPSAENQKKLEDKFVTCTKIHSDLLGEAISCRTPSLKTSILGFAPLAIFVL